MIIWFILQGILTISAFMIYISNSGYSGGEVGMTPLAVMLAVFIQFLFSVVFFYVLKKYLIGKKRVFFFILNMFLYELAYLLFSADMPIFSIFESGLMGGLNRGYSLCSILSGIIIIIAFLIFNSWRNKNIKNKIA